MIDHGAWGFAIGTAGGTVRARRLLLATGAWSRPVAALLGLDLPVQARTNTVSVTERAAPIVHSVIGHATGLLSLKQKPNGTVLIGGGWQGRGAPQEGRGELVPETLLTNLRLAQFAVPALANLRVVRSLDRVRRRGARFLPAGGCPAGHCRGVYPGMRTRGVHDRAIH